MRHSLSEAPFGAFSCYSPSGTSNTSVRSRKICGSIKNGNELVIRSAFRYFDERRAGIEVLDEFLNGSVTLVPVPRSAPLVEGALWPSNIIADLLHEHGLGGSVLPCIKRIHEVRKSAFQAPGNRPTVKEHYDSMEVDGGLFQPAQITLVDDVITKGSTQLACAMRLREAFPEATIRAFAMARTKGFGDIDAIVVPYAGRIYLDGPRANRSD